MWPICDLLQVQASSLRTPILFFYFDDGIKGSILRPERELSCIFLTQRCQISKTGLYTVPWLVIFSVEVSEGRGQGGQIYFLSPLLSQIPGGPLAREWKLGHSDLYHGPPDYIF